MALPFTTPVLGGVRARLSRNRGLELAVRNPSGGRGVYVMPWTAIIALCRPTLYDKVVCNRIAFLETLTPATVGAVVRVTAAEGLAGEAAMQAARAAAKTHDDARRIVANHLLSSLIRQVETARTAAIRAVSAPDEPDLDARARQTVAWLAPRLGQSAGWAMQALDTLANTMTGIGVNDATGRVPALISRLRTMRQGIAEWAGTQPDSDRVFAAYNVCSISDHTRSVASTMVDQGRRLTVDMIGLLRHWATDPGSVIQILERPEWLLDGWEQICLTWDYAQDNAARRVALVEIADQIPLMPRELDEWSVGQPIVENVRAEHAHIALNEDWRTGSAFFDLIARNEQLRAAAS